MDNRISAHHYNQAKGHKASVWFSGSTALKKGMGVCYNLDTYTALSGQAVTDAWGRRGNEVQVPGTSNNLAFAGVTTQAYTAKTGGQRIDIWIPGSICEVACGLPTVINSTRLTCSVNSADAGRFTLDGFKGRGSALALQTKANAAGADITFYSLDGSATAAYAASVTTITKTGIGTACGYGDDDIDPTEFVVVILGGADDATGGDASSGEMATTGEYAVLTAPTEDTITIATDIGDVDVALYVIKNTYPTVLCYLEEGPESGLQEVISPRDALAAQSMVGGTTILCGGYTMAAASTATLADGTANGMRKAYAGLGTLTTSGYAVSASGAIDDDGGSAATITLDAAGEYIVLEFNGLFYPGATAGVWHVIGVAGATRS